MALTKITSSGVGLVSATTVKTATNEEDALLVEQADGTDVGALRINNGRFILSGRNSSNPVQIQTHDGNEDIEVDPDGFIKMETAGAERLRIDASGKVAIGSTNNGASGTIDLSVGSTSSSGGITLWSPTSGTHSLGFGDGYSGTDRYRGYLEYAHSDDSMRFATAATERMRLTSSGSLEIASGGFKAIGVYNNTTGTGANVVVDSAGGFARSTSSRRYKNTINDATHGLTELLTLRPVTYKGNNDGDTLFGGLIAEEVHDAGLTEFVRYNDDNEPDALAYGHMVSLCVKAIQEQQEVIESLKARITALEAE